MNHIIRSSVRIGFFLATFCLLAGSAFASRLVFLEKFGYPT